MARGLITPSSLKQTIACPPSAVYGRESTFSQGLPAIRGDFIHAVSEDVFQNKRPNAASAIGETHKKLVTFAHSDAVLSQAYVDWGRSLADWFRVEWQVDLSRRFALPPKSCRGKIDLTSYDRKYRIVHISDLKTGTWPVDPKPGGGGWPQMATYGVGALYRLRQVFDIRFMRLNIWQNFKVESYDATPEQLYAWQAQITALAARVFAMARDYDRGKNIPRDEHKPSNDNCRFCNAPRCPYRWGA